MQSFGETVHDSTIRHQIFLERFKTTTVKGVIKLLNETEADVVDQIRRLDDSYTRRRLESVLNEVRAINRRANAEILRRAGEDVEAFAAGEMSFVTRQLNDALPGAVGTAIQFIAPSEALLLVAAEGRFRNHLIRGRELGEWLDGLMSQDTARLEQAIRVGYVQGESTASIVRRIRGTRALRFNDGVRNVTRNQLDSLVRTTVQSASTAAREAVYAVNAPLIKKVRYIATLDGRTTPICRSLDQREFPVSEGPRPPVHFRCRSTTIPITLSWAEMGLNRPETPRPMRPYIRDKRRLKDIPKADRDALVGRVPGDLSYGDWLKKQPVAFQDDVLGASRGKLFREGGLTVDKFVDLGTQREFTLAELRRREPDAFLRAGFDAEEAARRPQRPAFQYERLPLPKTYSDANEYLESTGAAVRADLKGLNIGNAAPGFRAILEAKERFDLPEVRGIGPISRFFNTKTKSLASIYTLGSDKRQYFHLPTKYGNPKDYEKVLNAEVRNLPRYEKARSEAMSVSENLGDLDKEVTTRVNRMREQGHSYSFTVDSADPDFTKRTRSTAYHEMGHVMHLGNTPKGAVIDKFISEHNPRRGGWQYLLSKYAGSDNYEYIAEAFAVYMGEDSSHHYRIHPALLKLFQEWDGAN